LPEQHRRDRLRLGQLEWLRALAFPQRELGSPALPRKDPRRLERRVSPQEQERPRKDPQPEPSVVRRGLLEQPQKDRQPLEPLERHQTDPRPARPLPEPLAHDVRCRRELRESEPARSGASRLRFRELVHSAVVSRRFVFGTGRREPWSDTFPRPSGCCLGRVPGYGQRGRNRWYRWLRDRPLFRSRLWLQVPGRAS
jgi:hypothetical protein